MHEPRREKAVALKYLPHQSAPFIVAKAGGRSASRLKAIAVQVGIPVLRDEALSEALYPLEIGDFIPEAYYEIVARVFAFVKRIEEL